MPTTTTFAKIRKFFPARAKDSHKGMNGKVLVIGGSSDLIGAPALAASAALAALRGGVDLCVVLAPEKAGLVINSYSPDIIVRKVKGDFFTQKNLKMALGIAGKNDVVLLGNGMGREKQALSFAKKFVQKCRRPVVLDADGIRACAGMKFGGIALITPHEKEFEIFSGKKSSGKTLKEKIALVKKTAERHKCVVLLKGRTDIISDGAKIALNNTGNAGMTKGGTGDILAGLCAAYISLGLNPFNAAQAAAFVNGKIGEGLLREKGFGFIASDFAQKIPAWTKRLLH